MPTRSHARPAHLPARLPGRWRGTLLLTLIAITSVGLTATGITPAQAATHAVGSAATAGPTISPELAASVRAGTAEDDIRSGRITVDQLADAAEVASGAARGLSPAARAAERAQLVQETTEQVAELRLSRPGQSAETIAVDADASGRLVATVPGRGAVALDASSGASATAASPSDPLVASDSWRSFWHHITHASIVISISPTAAKILFASAASLEVGALCAVAGAVACAFIGAAGTAFTTWLLNSRWAENGFWLHLPDYWESRPK